MRDVLIWSILLVFSVQGFAQKVEKVLDFGWKPAPNAEFRGVPFTLNPAQVRNSWFSSISVSKPRESSFFHTGERFPAFIFRDITGNVFNLDSLGGKVVVLNFWFTSCGPCIREIPILNQMADSFPKGSVVFLAIALDNVAGINSLLRRISFHYQLIPDGFNYVKTLGINVFPTHVIIDQNGIIYYHSSGNTVTLLPWMKASIRALLSRNHIPFRA